MSLELLFLYVLTEGLFCISPGPAVAMTLSAALSGRWRRVLLVIMGILVGNGIYFILSAILLTWSLTINEALFTWIKYAGAAYLIYFVVRELIHSKKNCGNEENISIRSGSVFRGAIVMQLANPKNILFFAAFLPQFITPDINPVIQFGVLAALSFLTEGTILSIYTWLILLAADRARRFTPKIYIKWAGYTTMIIAVVWSLWL